MWESISIIFLIHYAPYLSFLPTLVHTTPHTWPFNISLSLPFILRNYKLSSYNCGVSFSRRIQNVFSLNSFSSTIHQQRENFFTSLKISKKYFSFMETILCVFIIIIGVFYVETFQAFLDVFISKA